MKGKLTRITGIYTLLDKDGRMIASDDVDFQKDYQINKLSKQNCDEIFGVVDVEVLAGQYSFTFGHHPEMFLMGFNKAMELNKDKVFTLEDMKRAFKVGFSNGFASDIISQDKLPTEKENLFNEFIQSIQQPTEIEVEIVMGDPIGITDNYTPDTFPKLDVNNCLILKKL